VANVVMKNIRQQYPRFFRSVYADARVNLGYRSEGDLKNIFQGIFHIIRLMWVGDAFFAQVCYRARCRMYRFRIPLLPTILHRICMSHSQVCIGKPVVIQPGMYIAHGQVAIDGFVKIDSGVVLLPWVTIGLKAGNFQGPTIEKNVHIGTGAKIIGPITVGKGSKIGANAVVVKDVPATSTVAGVPAALLK
jgi:serine O-acetyltransferase